MQGEHHRRGHDRYRRLVAGRGGVCPGHPRHHREREGMEERTVVAAVHDLRREDIGGEQIDEQGRQHCHTEHRQRREDQRGEDTDERKRPVYEPQPTAVLAIAAHLKQRKRQTEQHVQRQHHTLVVVAEVLHLHRTGQEQQG